MQEQEFKKAPLQRLGKIIIVFAGIMVLITVFKIAGVGAKQSKALVDFDIFYLAGKMVWDGSVADAYSFQTMAEAQHRYFGTQSFMPWTYPPPFNLVLAPFALLSISVAYLLFTAGSLIAYLIVLHALAREHFGIVLLATFPATTITISCGQNGFVTGSLIGLCAIFMLKGRGAAGVPLGLMIIKPHLAIGLSGYVLGMRRWSIVGIAALIVIFTTAVSTIALGTEIWPAFLKGAREARIFLAEGFYPLFRMVSIYATLHTLGVSATSALIGHVALGLAICTGLALLARRTKDQAIALGCSILATLFISPYLYDYDLPVLAVAAALLCRTVMAHANSAEIGLMLGLAWISSGWGLFTVARAQAVHGWDVPAGEAGEYVSFAGVALALLALQLMVVLRRSLSYPRS